MKKIILYISVLLFTYSITAQNTERFFETFNWAEGLPSIKVNDGIYIFLSYSPEIVETIFLPDNEKFNLENSHAVIKKPDFSSFEVIERDKDVLLKTKGIEIIITKSPFQISYYYNDKLITSEKRGYFKSVHESMDLAKDNIVADSTEKIEFNLTKDEVLYGAGSRALGMNRRGNRLPLYNRAHYGYGTRSELMNYTMPIVLSSNKYMIHFDNAPVGYLDLDSKAENTLTYETISGRKTYQVIVGETWYDIIDNYTDLTGKQPMLPRWTLGNFSSRFGYHSQKETLETIDKFKTDQVPVDAVILDLYWFGKEIQGTLGNFEFYKDSFPEPEKMIKTLKSQNVETILITEPYVLKTSNRWDEAVEKGILAKDSLGNSAEFEFYFGNGGIIDIYNPKGKKWFKDIYKDISEYGVNGFWGDLGEPEALPSWVNFENAKADEVHNIYGHDWAKLVYEASLEANPNRRPFILMRAGYSGSQRYGLVPWSGDVSRSWEGLQPQPAIALQMGMQGLAYMHSDLGGFAGANLDDELYVRWLQYGVFNPIFRPHAHEDVASEPIFRSEKAKRLAKFAIQMRYRMLPYNYNLMFENHIDGKPLMRPLFFEESDNPELFNYSKAYLWGNDILVSPVLEAGKTEQEIYFPKTSNWFDIENDELIKGGQTKTVKLNEAFIPTYVRAGAFIPLSKSIQSTSEYDSNSIELHYYFDKSFPENKLKFYNDDGMSTNSIENGDFELLEFESNYKGSNLKLEFNTVKRSRFTIPVKSIDYIIHNIEKEPKYIKVDGKKTKVNYNSKNRTLSIPVIWKASTEKEIKIKLKR
ncbi:TIM-barrel domain-containing protein [uncultured Winogradskyella sp.]|uniref:TIM-barrel domain-containing protein n=1 Tax=uncultured Winogradskyella sp. TaxID=395353 RepID=UPI00260D187C|nr:TIM-barrel domain-containing protein [uncultured Winogradskyella sp.]